ncbi:MAG TPA: hypothetical protein VJR91_20400, partial [Burkholderia sp.]|nr:hypothetical protein [Burkholderia sp.]
GATEAFSPNDPDSAYIVEFWPHGMTKAGEDIPAYISHLGNFPHVPFLIDGVHKLLRRTSLDELGERVNSDLSPDTKNFVDLLFVVPGTAAYLTVADLISS